jgi:hypothetical protein
MAFKMMVESEGPSDDLRSILPKLACASTIFLGRSSNQKVKGYIEYDGKPNKLREFDVFKEIPLPTKMYLSETKKSVDDYLHFVYAADSTEGTYILLQFGDNLIKPLLKHVAIEQDGQKIKPYEVLINASNWALLKVDFDPTKEFRIVEYINQSMTSKKVSIDKISLKDYTILD